MARPVHPLPDATREALHRLHRDDPAQRDRFLAALYAAGWPHSASAKVLGLSRETVREWATRADSGPAELPSVPEPPPRAEDRQAAVPRQRIAGGFERTYWVGKKGDQHKVTRTIGEYWRPCASSQPTRPLTPQECRKIARLRLDAGRHLSAALRRKASEDLSQLISELVGDGATYKQLGQVLKVRPAAVRARLRRYAATREEENTT